MAIVFKRINRDQALEGAIIMVKSYIDPPWNEDWSMEKATARINELSTTPGWLGVGAMDEHVLCGFAIGLPHTSASGRTLYIPEIVVAPSHRRRGIGTNLLKLLEQEARAFGFSSTWLLSQHEGAVAAYYTSAEYKPSPKLRVYSKPIP